MSSGRTRVDPESTKAFGVRAFACRGMQGGNLHIVIGQNKWVICTCILPDSVAAAWDGVIARIKVPKEESR